jgi:hypothetical protein
MPGSVSLLVAILGIPHMGATQGLGQGGVALGQDNQMARVLHQAIAQHGQMILQTVVSDPREGLKPIVKIGWRLLPRWVT